MILCPHDSRLDPQNCWRCYWAVDVDRSMCDGCCDHIDGGSGSRLLRDGTCPCICHERPFDVGVENRERDALTESDAHFYDPRDDWETDQ